MKNGSRSYIQVGHDMLTFIVKGGGVTHFPIGASIDVNKHDYLICLYYFLPNRHYLITAFSPKCAF